MITSQQFYDRTIGHLVRQGKQSAIEAGSGINDSYEFHANCQYRDGKGNSCAVGCHVPDSIYSPAMEGCSASRLREMFSEVTDYLADDIGLMTELQRLHDSSHSWDEHGFSTQGRQRARSIAQMFKLIPYSFDRVNH